MAPLRAIALGGGGTEDRFTHVLCSLLQHKSVSRAFASRLLGLTPGPDMVATAQQGVEGGRADLQLAGGGVFAIIEVKVGADLHEPQMQVYAKEAVQHPGGCLFVLTASGALRGILDRARDQVAGLAPDPASEIAVGGISWHQVAELFSELKDNTAADLEGRTRVYLEDFAGLIEQMIEHGGRPFLAEEIETIRTGLVADYSERLETVLEDVLGLLRKEFAPSGRQRALVGGRGFLGSYVAVEGFDAWFGIVGGAWREQGATPYWIQPKPVLLPTWDRLAITLGLPTAKCRNGLVETLIPVAFPQSGQTLAEIAEGVADRAAVILRAMPEAYRLAGVVGTLQGAGGTNIGSVPFLGGTT